MAVEHERKAVLKKGLLVTTALCLAMSMGTLTGCGGDDEASNGRDPNMPAADAELLDYINAYYDDYEDAVSLEGIPSDVILSASEQLQIQKAMPASAEDGDDSSASDDEAEERDE